MEVGQEAIAYPFSVLNEQTAVNDTIADTPILVVFDPDSAAGIVYERAVDGQTLTFSADADDPFMLTDAETGSTWNGFTGEATAGSLAGAQLERVKSTTSFWFGWKDLYPQTAVYRVD